MPGLFGHGTDVYEKSKKESGFKKFTFVSSVFANNGRFVHKLNVIIFHGQTKTEQAFLTINRLSPPHKKEID